MPLYEYRCHRCDKTFEIRQKFAEAPLKVHEGCGGDLERIIFASALQFKGSGFYVNDYGRGGKSPAHNGSKPKPESKTESKSESKPESKGESKPESKSESKPESKSQDQSQSRPADSGPSSEK
jgi:putative FmdB family regulatory protein